MLGSEAMGGEGKGREGGREVCVCVHREAERGKEVCVYIIRSWYIE